MRNGLINPISANYNHDTLQFPDKYPLTFSSVSELNKETNTCPPKSLLAKVDYSLYPSSFPLTLPNLFTDSNYLFHSISS